MNKSPYLCEGKFGEDQEIIYFVEKGDCFVSLLALGIEKEIREPIVMDSPPDFRNAFSLSIALYP